MVAIATTGVFRRRPTGTRPASRRYLRNTAVLETLLDDDRGNALRIIDFCPRFRSARAGCSGR
jgi:hypothetical protein